MTPYCLIFSMCSFRIQLCIITKQIKRSFFSYIVNHINIIHCFFLFLNFVAFFHLIEIFFEVSILTLWLLRGEEGEGGGHWNPVMSPSFWFSFSDPHFQENERWVHCTPSLTPSPAGLTNIKVEFFKTLFLKK